MTSYTRLADVALGATPGGLLLVAAAAFAARGQPHDAAAAALLGVTFAMMCGVTCWAMWHTPALDD